MTSAPSPRQAQSAASIAEHIRARIASGEWQPGHRIASENSLCRTFGVCRATVTKAIKRLEAEGLLVSQHGKGRFVTTHKTRRRTWAIGMVFSDMERLTHPVLAEMIAGAKDRILQTDYHLKIIGINAASRLMSQRRAEQALSLIDPQSLDGAIIMTRDMPEGDCIALAQHVPVLCISRGAIRGSLAAICYDAAGGMHDAACHVRDIGHRRVALVTVPPVTDQGRLQSVGVQLAFRDLIARGEAQVDTVIVERNRVEIVYPVMRQWLSDHRPTAVIAGSDEIALGVYQAAKELGIAVPAEMSLTGWNDTLSTRDIPVAMTTIATDYTAYAHAAVDCLMQIIEGRLPIDHYQQTPVRLIIRDSTAPPARR